MGKGWIGSSDQQMQTGILEWINNKVLLNSTEKYIQYPMISHKEKEHEKECVCVCVCMTESRFCTAVTQHCNSTIYFNFRKKC